MHVKISIIASKNYWGRKLNPIPSCMFTMSISWVPMWWLTSSYLLINELKGRLVRLITFSSIPFRPLSCFWPFKSTRLMDCLLPKQHSYSFFYRLNNLLPFRQTVILSVDGLPWDGTLGTRISGGNSWVVVNILGLNVELSLQSTTAWHTCFFFLKS